MKERLRDIIQLNTSLPSRLFNHTIHVLIVLSLLAFSIETLPSASASTRQALYYFEVFTIVVFTVEYLLRIWVAQSRPGYIFSFYGLIDLIAILPFYLAFAVDLRSVRAFRLLRLLRLLKLLRNSESIGHLALALKIARDDLIQFSAITLILLYLSAVGIYYFEHEAQPERYASIFDALWWAVATLTTVGYGDIYPITAGGRAFTFFILMLGLGIVAATTGILASALNEARRQIREQADADKMRGFRTRSDD